MPINYKKIIRNYSAFTVLVVSILMLCYSFFNSVPKDLIIKFNSFIVISLTLYIISVCLEEMKHIEDSKTNQTQLKEKIEDVEKNLLKELVKVNQTQAEVIISSNKFYEKLNRIRNRAKKSVLLVNLDPMPPDVYGEDVRKEYFDSTIDFAATHPHITVKRIMSLPTNDKIKWAEELVENSKNLNNLHLAYFRIDDIRNYSPIPPLLSLQIIDEEEMLLLNPNYSYMPMAFKNCMYLKDSKVVKEIFFEYYNKIWELIERNDSHWCKSSDEERKTINSVVLKDGMDIEYYKEKIEWIKNIKNG
jgi:hypothetical protein